MAAAIRVLVVDDNDDLRRLVGLKLQLEDRFDVVAEAPDGAAALRVAERCRPDVVVLDLSMPVMDGLEALPLLRRLLPEARIVMLSGFDAARFADAALALGADAFLEKGRALDELVEALWPSGRSVGPPA